MLTSRAISEYGIDVGKVMPCSMKPCRPCAKRRHYSSWTAPGCTLYYLVCALCADSSCFACPVAHSPRHECFAAMP